MKYKTLNTFTKKILLLSIVLVLAHSKTLSQSVTDSITIHVETARKIALDLARLDYLDSTMIRKDSIIHHYIKLDSIRIDRIELYQTEVTSLAKSKNKALKRLKQNRKFILAIGVVAIIETIILILK